MLHVGESFKVSGKLPPPVSVNSAVKENLLLLDAPNLGLIKSLGTVQPILYGCKDFRKMLSFPNTTVFERSVSSTNLASSAPAFSSAAASRFWHAEAKHRSEFRKIYPVRPNTAVPESRYF